MEFTEVLGDAAGRRVFLRASGVVLVGGSAVFLAACGNDDESSEGGTPSGESENPNAGGGRTRDVEILNSALDLEHTAIAAYAAGARLLKGDALAVGKRFLAHEQEHADALSRAVRDLGGTPRRPKRDYSDVIGDPKGQKDVLELANMLENTAVAAYVDAIPKLASPPLRATAAAIVTNEAEHISVLRGALGLPPVPDAFVTGKPA